MIAGATGLGLRRRGSARRNPGQACQWSAAWTPSTCCVTASHGGKSVLPGMTVPFVTVHARSVRETPPLSSSSSESESLSDSLSESLSESLPESEFYFHSMPLSVLSHPLSVHFPYLFFSLSVHFFKYNIQTSNFSSLPVPPTLHPARSSISLHATTFYVPLSDIHIPFSILHLTLGFHSSTFWPSTSELNLDLAFELQGNSCFLLSRF
jgi:hypothetical protein